MRNLPAFALTLVHRGLGFITHPDAPNSAKKGLELTITGRKCSTGSRVVGEWERGISARLERGIYGYHREGPVWCSAARWRFN